MPSQSDAQIGQQKEAWHKCLAKSGGYPGRCEKLAKELQLASKAAGIDSCVDETTALMKCTSAKKDTCSAQFLAMRECNRAGGRELVREGQACAVAHGKESVFAANASQLVTSTPPARTLQGMLEFGQDYAQSLGIAPGQVRF
eukprot:TRINITY_DN5514_c0_g1_i1.p2 TRINITY_DN5514_c0_g1~~TRINITY_DN5514_c0_g1_i1.p2  ORF type:complete len:143 (-),score=47.63 TRINITY_DN5514_c0_g1_i1:101-529(-)